MSDIHIPDKLKLAASETAEELVQRIEREKRAQDLQREDQLNQSIGNFKVGSVPYLNAAPLNRGIENQLIYAVPSQLAKMLKTGELDAALVSTAAVLFSDDYDILDGIAIASLGEVQSVFLAHKGPLADITEVFYDTASLSSLNLLKVLLAEKGIKPEYKPLNSYDLMALPDYALLIGDIALDFLRGPHEHQIWDLGAAWLELTQTPFVYAVWALQRGRNNSALRRQLREAKSFGMDTLDYIISSRTDYDYNFRKDYLSWHVHYHLGSDEKRGINQFVRLLRKHQGEPVYDPHYVA